MKSKFYDMKNEGIDSYTKGVLTVIAICLVIITINQVEIFPKAYANDSSDGIGLTEYGLVPLNEDGSITVRLSALDEIDVNIVGVETSDELEVELVDINTSDNLNVDIRDINTSDVLDVNIDQVGGYSNYGSIKVEIKD